MEVKDIQGNILIDALVTEQAVKTDELMRQHSITLSWVSVTNDELPLGAYIEHEGIRYSLLAPYKPEQSDEATFEYEPVFQHPVMRWQYLPFLFYTYADGKIISKEPDWSLTDNAANFMSVVCDAIENMTGEKWSYEIADNLPASASLSFNNTDIFSALGNIASQFETEWWFDYGNKVLYLSKASHGEEVTLEVGKNIGIPSVTQSKEGYYTRFLVFGSTRNIEQDYKGANTNSIVNRRLTLDPVKYPDGYIDIREGLTSEEILSKTLVFDDIYPRSSLTISDVKVVLKWRLDDSDEKIKIGTDAEGNPVYDQYAVWYFKIPNFKYNEELAIPNKPLSVHFNDGPLQGREFELWHEDDEREEVSPDGTAIRVEKDDYRIKYIEEGSYIIPAITGLIPIDGNKITLFNIRMPEEYKASAYDELEKAALKEIAKQSEDMSNYSFSSNPVEFFTSNPNLTVGRKVTYKNGDYSYSTRIIKLETQLDRPFEQKITIGNEQIKGNSQTLKEEVLNANQNIDLIASINESTQQLVQSYQRTQKALQESMAQWGDMWQLDKEHNAVRTPYNFITDGTIAMKELGDGEGETETVAGALEDLEDVNISSPVDGETLVYNEETKQWENKLIESGLDEDALEQFLDDKKYATQDYVNTKDREQFSSLQSNTTTPVSITIGGTTKSIAQDKMRSSLGLGSAAYETKDTFATKKALDETDTTVDAQAETIERLTESLRQANEIISSLQQRLRAVEDWGFQFTMTPQGSRVLVTPHNFASEGAISFAGLSNDEEFEQKIVLITQEGYDELVASGQVNETKIYYVY